MILYNRENVLKFYKIVLNADVSSISFDRINELNEIIKRNYYYFHNNTLSRLELINKVAEKMRVSHKWFGINTPGEMAYFFIMMVDPNFYFLEAYESGNTTKEQEDLCRKNFYMYDSVIIALEKRINNYLHLYDENDLWCLDRIKK